MEMNDDEIANLSRVIAGVLVAIYLFWVFAVPPIMARFSGNVKIICI